MPCCFRFPFPLPTSHRLCLRPPPETASRPGRARSRRARAAALALRSFRQHKRVRVVCGAAVEEDRRQIQSSTLPKRTSGTLTRQHYSTTPIHDSLPHHYRRLPPPTPPTPLLSPPPRLLRLPSTPPPRPPHPTATAIAPKQPDCCPRAS